MRLIGFYALKYWVKYVENNVTQGTLGVISVFLHAMLEQKQCLLNYVCLYYWKKKKKTTRLKQKAKNMSDPSDSTNKSEVLCNQTCNASPCL